MMMMMIKINVQNVQTFEQYLALFV